MASQDNSLVSEYVFSNTPTITVDTNVLDWWNVCLSNKRVSLEYTEQDWESEQLVLSKLYLYNYYCRFSVGESVGVMHFWTQFKQLVSVVHESYDTITIGTLANCIDTNSLYSPGEQKRTFAPRMELEK